MIKLADDHWNMGLALDGAHKAYSLGEVPVGAALISESGETLSLAHNLKEKTHDPCGHAEILALREAAKKRGEWRLSGCTLYVTLSPCLMCLGAMTQARIQRLVFGAYDFKGGGMELGYRVPQDQRLNHRFAVTGGVRHYECSGLLSQFFKERRDNYQMGLT